MFDTAPRKGQEAIEMPELNGTTEEIPVHEMREHFEYTRSALEDIDKDLECLMDMEKEEKNMGEGFDSGALLGMMANKGVDPAVLAMLGDRRNSGDWGDGSFLALFILIVLFGGWGGNGFGNRGAAAADGFAAAGLERSINAASDYGMLMDVLNSNGTKQEIALQNLAQSLNCSSSQIQMALADVKSQVLASQGNLQFAVQNAQNALQAQLADCCCKTNNNISTTACATQREIERQGCQTRSDIQDVRYLISSTSAAQDNLIQSQFAAQNAYLAQQFAAQRMEALSEQNDRLREQLARQSQEAQTALLLNAIANKDTIAGSYNATAATFTGTLS